MTPIQAAIRLLSPNRLTIFIFHRVLPSPDPLFPDEPDAARFEQMMCWVKSWFNVMPLDAAVNALIIGNLPPCAAAITFDDGYADNCVVALPILKRQGLSATFFIATGFLDGGRMWNDTIIESIRACPEAEIDLERLRLGRLPMGDPRAKREAIEYLIGRLKYLPLQERVAQTELITEASKVQPPTDLMMTAQQVRELHQAGMQIGAHTVSHPILARISINAAYDEIKCSRDKLQSLLGDPVTLFAYPNGKPGTDYLAEHATLVKELGFSAAVSTAWGAATKESDIFQLPRFTPWDKSRLKFGMRLVKNLRRL